MVSRAIFSTSICGTLHWTVSLPGCVIGPHSLVALAVTLNVALPPVQFGITAGTHHSRDSPAGTAAKFRFTPL